MKYRGRTEIVSIILEIVSHGATKTKIMYDAYLSYTQLTEYLSFLIETKLIKRQEGLGIYKLTEKGHRYYLKCKEIDEMLETKEIPENMFDTKVSSHPNRMNKV